MRLSATDIETDLVDLSGWSLREVMALRDPQLVQAQNTLLRHLVDHAVGLRGGDGSGSPYFAAQQQDQQDLAAAQEHPARTPVSEPPLAPEAPC
ncbi:hypothetical protein [Streptomyces sp. NPDC052693]|uniref:hypothetical protein n=1 Tax=Streptomyces sp. NPDC052693 TaxID=3155814 RepID=UPI00341E7BC3